MCYISPPGYVEGPASASMQKQQWEMLAMTEEALRLLAVRACVSGDNGPGAARPVALLLAQALDVTDWRCFRHSIERETGFLPASTAAAAATSASTSRCSQLLRLISLALTSAKIAAVPPASWEIRQWGCCFELLRGCIYAAQDLGVPQRMAAARGAMAMLLQPACEAAVQLVAIPGRSVLAIVHGILERSCADAPPRICLEAMLSAPVWSVVELEAGHLGRHSLGTVVGPDSAAEAGGTPPPVDRPPWFDAQAISLADFLSALAGNLFSSATLLPVISSMDQRNTLLQHWKGMVEAYSTSMSTFGGSGRDEGCVAHAKIAKPSLFTANLQSLHGPSYPSDSGGAVGPSGEVDAPALMSEEMAASAVGVLSRVLCGPVWSRLLGYLPLSSECLRKYAGCIMIFILQAAAVLELHPALQEVGEKPSGREDGPGSSKNGGAAATASVGTSDEISDKGDVGDVSGSVGCSGGSDVGLAPTTPLPARRPPPSVLWKIARHSFAGLLTTDDLLTSFSIASAQLREVLASIVAYQGGASEGGGVDMAGGGGVNAGAGQQGLGSGMGGGCPLIGSRDWECVQYELLLGLPEELWGVRPCCNTACVRLEGPCEMEVKTRACGGGCGARYCCVACQEQAWRGGHQRNCAEMREMREKGRASK